MPIPKSIITLILIGGFIYPISSAGQEQDSDVSDSELKQFATAIQQVQVTNQESQEKMITTVEGVGLDVPRYNEILEGQADPEAQIGSEAELKKFEAASEEIVKIQSQAEQDMQQIIRDEGLSVRRYQQIAMIVQKDPELQAKLIEYMQ